MSNTEKNNHAPDQNTGRSHGMQGIDKAPGKETPARADQFVSETQKGKKVDADPSKNSGKPVNEENI